MGAGKKFHFFLDSLLFSLRIWAMDSPLVMQGRVIHPADVAFMRTWLHAHPNSNRSQLSRELCRAWTWRNGAGQLKDMACRSLLLKLEAHSQIQLPPRRSARVNPLRN